MTKSAEKKKIPTTTCPECEREWPDSSEQAVITDMVGRCYACLITEAVRVRDERVKAANYEIENCPHCTGVSGAREACVPCGGRGWQSREGEGLIQLVR